MILKTSILVVIFYIVNFAQVTGLSGWNVILDPGHSVKENMGIYNYSEAEKVLEVGLFLRSYLLNETDIDTVYMTRTNGTQVVSLTQRTDYANSIGAAWYHSIHSDAGGPTANSTLLLWGQFRDGTEKIPNGGKKMSGIMVDLLTRGYRISTRGSIGDCTFYGCTTNGPYLHVNRATNMPSELSEAGFHTNPRQNQLNMNHDWKQVEARTFYWTFLKNFDIQRPYTGITHGIVTDIESAVPVNGATITLNNKSYTTDTYASLFHLYTNDSDLLHNGFYYFDSVPPGTHNISVSAPGYLTVNSTVTISDTFFTFKDFQIVSTVPPKVASISPVQGDSLYPGTDNIVITFSRPMDKQSVNQNIAFNPTAAVTQVTWSNSDRTAAINTSNLQFATDYTLIINAGALDNYGNPIDGDGNGVGGDPYMMNFRTKVPDNIAPAVIYTSPVAGSVTSTQPVVVFNFDELLKTGSISGKAKVVQMPGESPINVTLKYYTFGKKAAINVFVRQELASGIQYMAILEPGIEDLFGNPTTTRTEIPFTVASNMTLAGNIDNFESGIGGWWQPQQSGSTVGIISELTAMTENPTVVNLITNSIKSMKLTYGWDIGASSHLLREYFASASGPSFTNANVIQAYVYGDGQGNKFRFAVRDAGPGGVEVSNWFTVDWLGWKTVQWDLSLGETGTWIGNGILENPLRFDSFQLSYTPGSGNTGEHYFDDLRYFNKTGTGVESADNNIPATFSLKQNYPNPFSAGANTVSTQTVIQFSVAEASQIKLKVYNTLGELVATVFEGELTPGNYSSVFDGRNLPSGVYIYRLEYGKGSLTGKMTLMK
ncbi:MAG: Ig-like domain-containing protein [Ignavibacteriaceae bacterium]|nr:Ig-like domain-containing protein [Ignavibacteriaceae bacterium]